MDDLDRLVNATSSLTAATKDGKNTKHTGPHCDGLCEGASYLITIKQLQARNAELEKQVSYKNMQNGEYIKICEEKQVKISELQAVGDSRKDDLIPYLTKAQRAKLADLNEVITVGLDLHIKTDKGTCTIDMMGQVEWYHATEKRV